MNILITGYSGFLGRHLIKKLSEHKLFVIDSNICNLIFQKETYDYFSSIKNIDLIFHLATRTKAGDYCLTHKGEQWIDNQFINTNVLSAWQKFHPSSKMVTFGTSCGYDRDLKIKSEDLYLVGNPEPSLFTYAMSKRMLLAGLLSLQSQYGMQWIYLIPSTLYGPNFDKDDSHFIFDLIKKIIHGKNTDEPVELWGDGYQKRELIYINDALDIILGSLQYNNEIFNVCSSIEYTIRDFANVICNYVGYDFKKIIFNQSKYVGATEKILDSSKIKQYGLIKQFVDIKNGIEKTIDYYSILYSNEK